MPIKLSSNESPLGACPKAIEAFASVAEHLEIYPEGSSKILRRRWARCMASTPSGSSAAMARTICCICWRRCYLGEGDEAVMSQYGFSVYPIITRATGAKIVMAPETDYTADVDAMLAAVTERTKMVFLANPNNPTGTYLTAAEVARLHAGLRPDILLVIDSAYAEYVTAADYSVGVDLVDRAENVVMVRTFSKMGLAAARIGWMYGPGAPGGCDQPHSRAVQRQSAGATGGGRGDARCRIHRSGCEHTMRSWRDWLTAELASNRCAWCQPGQFHPGAVPHAAAAPCGVRGADGRRA